MSKFQRLLKSAENQLDPLDRSVILTFDLATSTPSGLQKRWPNQTPLTSNLTLDNLAYLVEDRIISANARGAGPTQELFDYLAKATEKIRDDDALVSDGLDWPGE